MCLLLKILFVHRCHCTLNIKLGYEISYSNSASKYNQYSKCARHLLLLDKSVTICGMWIRKFACCVCECTAEFGEIENVAVNDRASKNTIHV